VSLGDFAQAASGNRDGPMQEFLFVRRWMH
jgi:hypothetical protein